MNKFDEYKDLWKNQELNEKIEYKFDKQYPDIIERLKKFQKKQFRVNLLKTLLVAFNLGFIIWILNAKLTTAYISLGLVIIFLSIILFMIFYWKIQFRLSKFNFDNDSTVFINSVIQKLKYQKQYMKNFFPIVGIVLLIGLNVLYLGLSNLTLDEKLILHIGMSIFLVFAIVFGYKQRMKHFKKVHQPLIEELKEIFKTIND